MTVDGISLEFEKGSGNLDEEAKEAIKLLFELAQGKLPEESAEPFGRWENPLFD